MELEPIDIPIEPGFTRVYRVVGEAEYQDILRRGRFRQGPTCLEGKWFADTIPGVLAHARAYYPDGDFRLVVADLPDDAPSLFLHPNLVGRGPARYLLVADLKGVKPRPFNT